MFPYIYPCKRELVPDSVVNEVQELVKSEKPVDESICRGTFLAQHQYQVDVHQWGFRDGRLQPNGPLRADDLARFAPPDSPPIGG